MHGCGARPPGAYVGLMTQPDVSEEELGELICADDPC